MISEQHLEVLVPTAMEVLHGEAILVAPGSEIDGVGLDAGEIQQRDGGDELATSKEGTVNGLGHVAPLRERLVAVAAALDQENQRDDDVPLLGGDPAHFVRGGAQLFLL